MSTLPAPSPELAAKILTPLTENERIPGVIMSPKAGHHTMQLGSFREVCRFLRTENWEEMLKGGGKHEVHYIDLKYLKNWIAKVFGDTILAEAIENELAKADAFGQQVGPIKVLLQQRLDQCEELTNATSA